MITLIEISLSNFQLSTLALDAIITISIIFLITKVVEKLKNAEKATHHRKNAEKKKTERDQQIKQFNIPDLHISTDLREKILNADASELLSLLNSGAVTSEEILLTYIERTRTIGLNNGLITEIAFKEALIQARECDRLRKENPSAYRGALFGLPISIKDMFILKNTDASCGLASRLFKPAKDDGYIVKVLKQEGAIPFVKSNVPQAILLPHTNNNVWGLARNPWDKERSAGGSSGGEAALIASRCSPLGLANDLGGSVRIPAFFCGVVGFKPTVGRVTGAGTAEVASTLDYLQGLKLVPGPITKSAKDVNLMMKALLSDQSHQEIPLSEQDPHYVRIPWDENKVNQKHKGLRIGYFTSMDYFPSSPANQRAIEEAAKALKSGGHEIVKVDFPNIENLVSISVQALMGDGEARFLLDTLEGEAPIDEHVGALKVTSMPQLFKKALRLLLDVLGEKRAVRMLDLTRKLSVYESTKLAEQQAKARKEFLKVWEDNKLDALLSPGLAIPAAKSSLIKDLGQAVCYATFFNVLDMPTGAVPVTVVKEGEDQYPKEATKYHDMMYRKTVESMQGTVGLPVGVQVTTLPWQEEKCVNVMIALEEELQFRKKYPFPK